MSVPNPRTVRNLSECSSGRSHRYWSPLTSPSRCWRPLCMALSRSCLLLPATPPHPCIADLDPLPHPPHPSSPPATLSLLPALASLALGSPQLPPSCPALNSPCEPSLQVRYPQGSVSIIHPAPCCHWLLPQPISLAALGSNTSLLQPLLLQSMGDRKSSDKEGNPAQILTRVISGAEAVTGKHRWAGSIAHRGAAFESFMIWPKAGCVGSMTGGVPHARGDLIHTSYGHKSRLRGHANTLTGKTWSPVKQWHYFLTWVMEMAEPFLLT